MPLPPLASRADVEARLGRSLSDQEALKVDANLRDASAQARNYCNLYSLDRLVRDVVTCYMQDGSIDLPGLPVTAVNSVTAKGDTSNGLPDLPVPWFHFDGIDRVYVDPAAGYVINLPEMWFEYGNLYTTFDVNLDHGLSSVPDEVIMVVANAAIGVMTAPSTSAGLIGETIGPYAWHGARNGGGLTVALTQADLAALRDFHRDTGTIVLPGRERMY
jgi:hypothetical protein